jgi:hypothetical protein
MSGEVISTRDAANIQRPLFAKIEAWVIEKGDKTFTADRALCCGATLNFDEKFIVRLRLPNRGQGASSDKMEDGGWE